MPKILEYDPGGFVEAAGFINDVPFVADAEGVVRFLGKAEKTFQVHDGLLCAQVDGTRLVTGGEDGRICATDVQGNVTVLHEISGKWIDTIAIGPNGYVAYAHGKTGGVIATDGSVANFECERTIEGLAFAPKGLRLAVARYDGVELRFVSTIEQLQFLEWKGAHTDVCFSPDGKYVVSTMQENALHGWRLTDNKHMRMSGYPTKVESISWAAKGKWLATSGAPAAIVWPFSGKDGPMGKAPQEIGAMGRLVVSNVCCHPDTEIVAIGYENGLIMGARISDGKCVSLRPESGSRVTSMGWDAKGNNLAFGCENGALGIIDIAAAE